MPLRLAPTSLRLARNSLSMKGYVLFVGVLLTATIVAACTTGEDPPTSGRQAEFDEALLMPDGETLIEGEFSQGGIKAILGTSDLGVGSNRFGVALVSREGPVTEPTATFRLRHLDDEPGQVREADAVFRKWPYTSRGLYTAIAEFDRPGNWELVAEINGKEGPLSASLTFKVAESTRAPNVGELAVKSRNRLESDVDSIEQLTTGSLQDPELYGTTIADAVESGLPTVIVFASPAFCVNAVCGPQVEVLQELKNTYRGQAYFVHVDIYDNPHEIQGDLSVAEISTVVKEWGLPSIEWTFVIDREGAVSSRFEAFATLEEVEDALKRVL